jgi:4-cresol dehydrogenase (hydroxylating)
VISISFDKRDPVESARAQSCYQDAFDALMQAGYIPYRSNIHSMDKLAAGSETFWDVIKQLKQVLDPGHVLAPGRYEPGGRST